MIRSASMTTAEPGEPETAFDVIGDVDGTRHLTIALHMMMESAAMGRQEKDAFGHLICTIEDALIDISARLNAIHQREAGHEHA